MSNNNYGVFSFYIFLICLPLFAIFLFSGHQYIPIFFSIVALFLQATVRNFIFSFVYKKFYCSSFNLNFFWFYHWCPLSKIMASVKLQFWFDLNSFVKLFTNFSKFCSQLKIFLLSLIFNYQVGYIVSCCKHLHYTGYMCWN